MGSIADPTRATTSDRRPLLLLSAVAESETRPRRAARNPRRPPSKNLRHRPADRVEHRLCVLSGDRSDPHGPSRPCPRESTRPYQCRWCGEPPRMMYLRANHGGHSRTQVAHDVIRLPGSALPTDLRPCRAPTFPGVWPLRFQSPVGRRFRCSPAGPSRGCLIQSSEGQSARTALVHGFPRVEPHRGGHSSSAGRKLAIGELSSEHPETGRHSIEGDHERCRLVP